MEIRQLRSFQTVANLLSFNQAALKLHYSQSSISAQIQALEEEFGVQLFDRLGRRVQIGVRAKSVSASVLSSQPVSCYFFLSATCTLSVPGRKGSIDLKNPILDVKRLSWFADEFFCH